MCAESHPSAGSLKRGMPWGCFYSSRFVGGLERILPVMMCGAGFFAGSANIGIGLRNSPSSDCAATL